MKKIQFGLAGVLLACGSAASAQSSVTMYGRIDTGIEYVNHIGTSGSNVSRWSAEGGDWGTSMFGLKGVEELGAGSAAIFNLETAFQAENGTIGNNEQFSRRAYVGLKNDTWGQIQAGRNLFIDSDGVWEFDPMVQQAVSSASLVRGRNWQQSNNNIEYHSPVFGGLDVQGQYSLGNQPGSFNSGATGQFGRSDGIMLSYHSDYFDLRGIYDELRDSNGRFSNIFASSREYFAGANVRITKVKLQAGYTHLSAPDSGSGIASSANYYWLGGTYQATPVWALTAAGFYIDVGNGNGDATHDGGGHASLYALSTTYNLSKRTFLYGTLAYVKNGQNSSFSVFANSRGTTSSTSPLAGESQTGAYVGMMHTF